MERALRRLWRVIACLAGLLAFSRGLFDAAGLHLFGYLFQYLALGCVAGGAWLVSSERASRSGPVQVVAVVATSAFILIAVVSWTMTIVLDGFTLGFLYVVVMLFWALFLLTAVVRKETLSDIPWLRLLGAMGCANAMLGWVQQFAGVLGLPGGSWYEGVLRPPGSFGSMQHYAIALALVSAFSIEKWLNRGRGEWLVVGVMTSLAVLTSLTRSGYLILAGTALGLAVVFAFGGLVRGVVKVRPLRALVLLLTVVLGGVVFAQWLGMRNIVDRMRGVADVGATGNPERIAAWLAGVDLWSRGSVLVGSATGVATQATSKLFPGAETVTVNVESGIVQQLVNFGLLGAVAFYALLFCIFFAVAPGHVVMRAAVLSAIAQSAVYMSIETVPYMFLLGLAPAISWRLEKEIGPSSTGKRCR